MPIFKCAQLRNQNMFATDKKGIIWVKLYWDTQTSDKEYPCLKSNGTIWI